MATKANGFVAIHAEREAQRRRVREANALLPALWRWQAEVQQPHTCGCVLFAPVPGGWRCLRCMPPLDLPQALQTKIDATVEAQ